MGVGVLCTVLVVLAVVSALSSFAMLLMSLDGHVVRDGEDQVTTRRYMRADCVRKFDDMYDEGLRDSDFHEAFERPYQISKEYVEELFENVAIRVHGLIGSDNSLARRTAMQGKRIAFANEAWKWIEREVRAVNALQVCTGWENRIVLMKLWACSYFQLFGVHYIHTFMGPFEEMVHAFRQIEDDTTERMAAGRSLYNNVSAEEMDAVAEFAKYNDFCHHALHTVRQLRRLHKPGDLYRLFGAGGKYYEHKGVHELASDTEEDDSGYEGDE